MKSSPPPRRSQHPAALRSEHTIFSANSVALATDPHTNWRGLAKTVATVLAGVALIGAIWLYATRNTRAELVLAHVREKAFSYSVKFYRGAGVQDKNGRQYLIHTDAAGKQTAVWVLRHEGPLSCGDDPRFTFDPPNDRTEIINACYRSDGIIYVSNVLVDRQVYQLNLTSQKPVAREDAQAIFGSLQID